MIFVMVTPLFKSKSTQAKAEDVKPKVDNTVVAEVAEVDLTEDLSIKGKVPSLIECKRILNKDGEQYTDEEVRSIMNFIDNWARINAKTILNNANRS